MMTAFFLFDVYVYEHPFFTSIMVQMFGPCELRIYVGMLSGNED